MKHKTSCAQGFSPTAAAVWPPMPLSPPKEATMLALRPYSTSRLALLKELKEGGFNDTCTEALLHIATFDADVGLHPGKDSELRPNLQATLKTLPACMPKPNEDWTTFRRAVAVAFQSCVQTVEKDFAIVKPSLIECRKWQEFQDMENLLAELFLLFLESFEFTETQENASTEGAEKFQNLMQHMQSMMPKIESFRDLGVTVDLSALQKAVDACSSPKRRRAQP